MGRVRMGLTNFRFLRPREIAPNGSFLDPADEKDFMAERRRFLRVLRPVDPVRGQADWRPIDRVAAKDANELLENGSGLRCHVISIGEGDGMTWSAMLVEHRIAHEHPEVELIRLRGEKRETDLPEIAKLMSPRAFAAMAQKHGLTKKFAFVSYRMTVVLIVAAVIMGIVAAVVGAQLKSATSSPTIGLLLDYKVLGAGTVLGLLTLLGKWVRDRIALTPDGDDMMALGTRLHKRDDSAGYKALVEDFARRLPRIHIPRFVIVRRFERLDHFSQDVIFRYFAQYPLSSDGFELWVIFETRGLDEFAGQKVGSSNNDGYRQAKLWVQVGLDPIERRRLAERVGHPDRAELDTVGAICGAHVEAKMLEFFSSYVQKNPPTDQRYGRLDFFYLLALNFSRASSPGLESSKLAVSLSYHGAAETKLNMLRAFLRGTRLEQSEIEAQIANLEEEFGPYVFVEKDGEVVSSIRIDSEVGRWLEKNAPALQLPQPELGHIFWSLYWFDDTRGNRSPFWSHKIAAHLVATIPPKALATELPDAVTSELLTATRTITGECLRACMLDRVPNLLKGAASLLKSLPGEAPSGRTEDIVGLCWDAYALTGSEPVLKTIAELSGGSRSAGGSGGGELVAPVVLDPLEAIFVQSLGRSVSAGLPKDDTSIKRYARHRALWLALAVSPLADSRTPMLSRVASVTVTELNAFARDELLRIESLGGSAKAVDYLSLSMLLWCLTLALDRREGNLAAAETSESVRVLESTLTTVQRLRKTDASPRRIGGASVDLAVQAHELSLLVCSAARVLTRRQASTGAESEPAAKLASLAKAVASLEPDESSQAKSAADSGGEGLGATDAVLREVEERLELVRVIWATLGFVQFAEFTTIRTAQLQLVSDHNRTAESVPQVVTRLASVIQEIGLDGVMANLVAASAADDDSQDIMASHLCHAASAALNANFAQPLVGELCMLAILRGHSYSLDFDEILRHVANASGPGAPAPIQTYLADLPDDLLDVAANCLLNVASQVADLSLSQKVRADLAARTESAVEAFADEVRYMVELNELHSDLHHVNFDVDGKLEQWRERRASESYPFLLFLLFQAPGEPTDRLMSETANLLNSQTGHGRGTSWVKLASAALLAVKVQPDQMAKDDARARTAQAAVVFLKREYPAWAFPLSLEDRIQMLRQLIAFDPDNRAAYIAQLAASETRRQLRDGTLKLPGLVRDGKFFLLLWHYFETLGALGLRPDLAADKLVARLNLIGDRQEAVIEAWRHTGEQVPPALLYLPDGTRLNSDFLVMGHYLFNEPCSDDESLSHAREHFNTEAASAVRSFYHELLEVQKLPVDLRSVVEQHRRQLLPDDATAPKAVALKA